ncbi:MAG: tRNA lysidine(34) synthetase TilS [Alphaproteobacteria bacterium]|nr:tRNA lysidine(34) synthetase TilS [Alphaproteobacteria bacterium]
MKYSSTADPEKQITRNLKQEGYYALSADEFAKLIESYALKDSVVVAVSGGADSLALTLLMHEWAVPREIKVIGITVDHRLREESAKEALLVHEWLKARGIEHRTLVWQHSGITSALQQKAREARYELLSNWCSLKQITTLLTAHHLQDQWETFLMRLSKGSGITGLCGIKQKSTLNNLCLIRPLLKVSPLRLERTLERFNQPFLKDPSNDKLEYARIRMRKLLPIMSEEGLTPETIDRVQKRFQVTEDYLEQQLRIAIIECVKDGQFIRLSAFKILHKEIAYRLLRGLLLEFGGHSYPLSYESLELLYEKLVNPDFIGTTAGGCYLKRIKGGWVQVRKENRSKF